MSSIMSPLDCQTRVWVAVDMELIAASPVSVTRLASATMTAVPTTMRCVKVNGAHRVP